MSTNAPDWMIKNAPDWVIRQHNRDLVKPISQADFDVIMASIATCPVKPNLTDDVFDEGWYITIEQAKAAAIDPDIRTIIDSELESLHRYYTDGDFNEGYESAVHAIQTRLSGMIV
jgi:hypothetical protein